MICTSKVLSIIFISTNHHILKDVWIFQAQDSAYHIKILEHFIPEIIKTIFIVSAQIYLTI